MMDKELSPRMGVRSSREVLCALRDHLDYVSWTVESVDDAIRDGVRMGYSGLTGEDGEDLYVSGSRSDALSERDGGRRVAEAICGGMRGVYTELKSRGMI